MPPPRRSKHASSSLPILLALILPHHVASFHDVSSPKKYQGALQPHMSHATLGAEIKGNSPIKYGRGYKVLDSKLLGFAALVIICVANGRRLLRASSADRAN